MSSQRKPSKGGKGGHKTEGPGKYVEPGDDTGCYYLLISNLQKDTTWKDIKDFLNEAEIVPDNVEVFQKSTTGWIRFLGYGDFDAAIQLFKSKPCRGYHVTTDSRNATERVLIRNFENKDAGRSAAPTAPAISPEAAFSSQIPPLQMGGPSRYLPGNVSMSYTNPYATSSGPSYGSAGDYAPSGLEYYKAHPTHYHDAAPAEKTGYEGTEMYAASSRDLVDKFGSMSVRNRGAGQGRALTRADFKIEVKRHDGHGIDEEVVVDFVRSQAPATVPHIIRVDVLKWRDNNQGPPKRAVITFDNADACRTAREGMFDKEVNGIRLIQGALDDDVPHPQPQPEPESADSGAEAAAAAADDPAEKPIPKGPRPRLEGGEQRTRKEKLRDRRKETYARKKERKHQRNAVGPAAAAAEMAGPSGHWPPGWGSGSGYAAAPGAPGPSSAYYGGMPMDEPGPLVSYGDVPMDQPGPSSSYALAPYEPAAEEDPSGKGKAVQTGPPVVDGTYYYRMQQQ